MDKFVKSAGIRAIKTVCQTAVATIGTATVLGSVDWKMVFSASVLSGVLSVLTSIGTGLPEVEMSDKDYQTVARQKAEREAKGEYLVDYTKEPGRD